jgi:hypothetical protein
MFRFSGTDGFIYSGAGEEESKKSDELSEFYSFRVNVPGFVNCWAPSSLDIVRPRDEASTQKTEEHS